MNNKNKLIDIIQQAGCVDVWNYHTDDFKEPNPIEMLADRILADGWIRMPCKVGTEIFGLFDNDDEQRKEIYKGNILCYSLDENNLLWARMRYKNGLTYWHTVDEFGKTVFLSKEDAEQALKECEQNGDTKN